MKINAKGLEIIKRSEGLRLEAYTCPAGVWTIGYGHTGDVTPGMRITEHQAEVILQYDVEKFEDSVETLCPGATDNQFSALVSFCFNLGATALAKSTLRKRFLAGDIRGAADEFRRWCHAGGIRLAGLVKRREEERELFLRDS